MDACQLSLKEAVRLLENEELLVSANISENEINTESYQHLTYDSKKISEATLFFCKGISFKEAYLAEAVAKGAAAYISEKAYPAGASIPHIIVSDIRKAMGILAQAYYDYPQKKLKVIAFTGTKGKTSSTYFLKDILDDYNGEKTALFSTIATYTGDSYQKSKLTTPEALDLYYNMYQSVKNGMTHLVMEVSSQSYKTNRVYGLTFDIGVFLNISEDHISPIEHPDFEDYLTCKLQLMKNSRTAVINGRSREFDRIYRTAKEHAEKVIVFAEGSSQSSDYEMTNLRSNSGQLSFDLVSQKAEFKESPSVLGRYTMNLLGNFNAENATSAIICARECGCDYQVAQAAVLKTVIPGRMNIVKQHERTIVIDYAHNYVSMLNLMETVKADFPTGKKIVLFGSTGEKGISRRKDLGRVTGEFADYIFITEDDPQREDPMSIAKEIAQYIEPFGTTYEIVLNRSKAIEKAIELSEPGDVIVLAGKGEDAYQKRNGIDEYYETDLGAVKRIYQME